MNSATGKHEDNVGKPDHFEDRQWNGSELGSASHTRRADA